MFSGRRLPELRDRHNGWIPQDHVEQDVLGDAPGVGNVGCYELAGMKTTHANDGIQQLLVGFPDRCTLRPF